MSRQWTHPELDEALRALSGSIETSAPDYAERVTVALAERPSPARTTASSVRRRAVLVAAVALLALGLIAVPASRHAIASWFDFSGVDIRRAPQSAPRLPTPTEPASINAGPLVSLEEARASSGGRLALLTSLPAPTAVYMYGDSAVVIALAYRHVPGLQPTPDTGYALVITEVFDAAPGEDMIEKILYSNATADGVSVHDHPGVFIKGPQEIFMITVSTILARTSANTLIWSDDDATYRLEADFDSAAAALRIAEFVRPD
jgi:hypothetical protein